MQHFLFQYHPVAPTTWVYLSSLMTIGLFFKFNRFWSVRNLDILMLLALSPGLLMIYFGYQTADAQVDTMVAEQVEPMESQPDVETAEPTLSLRTADEPAGLLLAGRLCRHVVSATDTRFSTAAAPPAYSKHDARWAGLHGSCLVRVLDGQRGRFTSRHAAG